MVCLSMILLSYRITYLRFCNKTKSIICAWPCILTLPHFSDLLWKKKLLVEMDTIKHNTICPLKFLWGLGIRYSRCLWPWRKQKSIALKRIQFGGRMPKSWCCCFLQFCPWWVELFNIPELHGGNVNIRIIQTHMIYGKHWNIVPHLKPAWQRWLLSLGV